MPNQNVALPGGGEPKKFSEEVVDSAIRKINDVFQKRQVQATQEIDLKYLTAINDTRVLEVLLDNIRNHGNIGSICFPDITKANAIEIIRALLDGKNSETKAVCCLDFSNYQSSVNDGCHGIEADLPLNLLKDLVNTFENMQIKIPLQWLNNISDHKCLSEYYEEKNEHDKSSIILLGDYAAIAFTRCSVDMINKSIESLLTRELTHTFPQDKALFETIGCSYELPMLLGVDLVEGRSGLKIAEYQPTMGLAKENQIKVITWYMENYDINLEIYALDDYIEKKDFKAELHDKITIVVFLNI